MEQEELEKKVLTVLEKSPDGLNINQIAQQVNINRNTVAKCLKILEIKKKVISRKIDEKRLYYKV